MWNTTGIAWVIWVRQNLIGTWDVINIASFTDAAVIV
jgi:hypothetical protein